MMGDLIWSLGLTVLSLLTVTVYGYSSGAGAGACNNLTLLPGHSEFTPDRSAPYTISVPYTTYQTGVETPVTISGEQFQGFLIIAVSSTTGELIGSFAKGSGTLTSWVQDRCSSGNGATGLTHTGTFSAGTRDSVNVVWNPPAGNLTVQFYATVVKTFSEYYVKIPGPVLRYSSEVPQTPSLETTTSGASSLYGVMSTLLIPIVIQLLC